MDSQPQSISHGAKRGLLAAAVLLGLAVHGIVVVLWDPTPLPTTERAPRSAFLSMEPQGPESSVSREQALLLDTAPLFLPTPWNTALAGQELVESQPDPNLFEAFPDEITLDPEQLRPKPYEGGTRTISMLDSGKTRILDRLGRDQYMPRQLTARQGRFEVRRVSDNALVAGGDLPENVSLGDGPMLWQAATFLVQVAPTGVLGTPFQASGSGSETIDKALKEFVEGGQVVKQLRPGYYSITVGP